MKTLGCRLRGMVSPCLADRSALFGLVVCLVVTGCGGTTTLPGQRPERITNGSRKLKGSADIAATTKELRPDKPKSSADFSLTAEELEAEYQKDKQATEKKYKGKTIELSGVVAAVYGEETAFIGLVAGKRTRGLPCVMIDKEPWSTVAPGQTIKLRGPWATYGELPALYDCVIVEAGPNPAVVLTAAKLADEYAADAKGVKKKYTGKYVILTGEVIENKIDNKGGRLVRLKAREKVGIELYYGLALAKRGAKMRAGQTVKVFGELTQFDFREDGISLLNPLPITK